MTKPFSLRARPSLIAAMDARAATLGQDRTKYLLTLVEQDLSEAGAKRKRTFASHDLIGSVQLSGGAATNDRTRRVIAERLRTRHEKNR
jgi:hypothetical protein